MKYAACLAITPALRAPKNVWDRPEPREVAVQEGLRQVLASSVLVAPHVAHKCLRIVVKKPSEAIQFFRSFQLAYPEMQLCAAIVVDGFNPNEALLGDLDLEPPCMRNAIVRALATSRHRKMSVVVEAFDEVDDVYALSLTLTGSLRMVMSARARGYAITFFRLGGTAEARRFLGEKMVSSAYHHARYRSLNEMMQLETFIGADLDLRMDVAEKVAKLQPSLPKDYIDI